jgi:excisionase family DNA binding protein
MAESVLSNSGDRWFSTRQAAEYLGYAVQTIYNKVDLNEIPFVRVGGRTLKFRKSELDRWIIQQHADSETAA